MREVPAPALEEVELLHMVHFDTGTQPSRRKTGLKEGKAGEEARMGTPNLPRLSLPLSLLTLAGRGLRPLLWQLQGLWLKEVLSLCLPKVRWP